jgi:hypothetical protein
MESYLFKPDLNNYDQYTSTSKLQPFNFYNIMGVIINFDSDIKLSKY